MDWLKSHKTEIGEENFLLVEVIKFWLIAVTL